MLLGRLGRHDQALELYVYRLQDYAKAEEYVHHLLQLCCILTYCLCRYCKWVYRPEGPSSQVYLTLLRTYLQPTIKQPPNLLAPALELICRHSPRLDSVEALQLIPPLVTTREIQAFLRDALHAPLFDSKVLRGITKSRSDQAARKLMILQSNRVKVMDSRMHVVSSFITRARLDMKSRCPNCHKRIGNNSVIAVHAPRFVLPFPPKGYGFTL